MKKIISAILVIVSVFLLVSCELDSFLHSHAFGKDWKYDDNYHWHICECGEKETSIYHDFGTSYQKDAENHWQVCECGYETAKVAHTWDEGTVKTEPTDELAGLKTLTCTVCGEVKNVEIPAKGHTLGELVEAVAATCEKEGSIAYKPCTTCDKLFDEEGNVVTTIVVPALGHTEEVIPGKAATCEEAGLTDGKKCSVCGETTLAQEEIPALGHKAADAIKENEVPSTCTEKGHYESVVKCSVCGEELSRETVELPLASHTEEVVAGKAATCEEAGLTDGKKCSVCGEVLLAQEEIPALGHKAAEAVVENRVESTCEEAGSYDSVVYCNVCEEELSRETKALELASHTEEVIPGKAATCEEAGLTDGKKCSVCGETTLAQEEIPALGHKAADAIKENEVPSTCTEKGHYESVVKCSVCGEELSRETVELPLASHTEEVVAGKAATCEEAGLTDGKKCSVCGETKLAQEEIPALGHKAADAIKENEVPSTCTEKGHYESVVKCSVCGEELSRETVELPLASHTEEVVAGKAATCEEAGLTEGKKCSVCDKELLAQEEIPALGHEITESYYQESEGSIVFVEVCSREHNITTNTGIEISVPSSLEIENILGVSADKIAHNVTVTEGGQAYEGSDISFVSSDETIVTVDTTNVTVVNAGSTTITISYKGNDVSSFVVNVINYNPVKTVEDFLAIGSSADTMALNYKLMNDIDFEWAKVACFASKNTKDMYFKGIFDGQNHTLMNIELEADGTNVDVGLFGSLSGATIKNLNIIGVKTLSVGGVIASFIDGGSTVENCYVDATVVGMTYKADGSLQNMSKNVNGGVFAWRINDGSSKLINCISVVKIEVTDATHVTALESWYGGFVGANYGTIDNCQTIVLSEHTLKEYTSPAATNTKMENSKVYNSVSEFYDEVEASRYPGWTFDENKEVLPHLGSVNVPVKVEDVEIYAGNNIQLTATSLAPVNYSLADSIEGVTLTDDGLLTVADTVAADTVIQVLVTNVYGMEATINVTVKSLPIEVSSIESILYDEYILGVDPSTLVHEISVTQNGNAVTEGITYVSSDEAVATVDATSITIIGKGEAKISVLYNDEEIHSFNVTINSIWHPVTSVDEFLAIRDNLTYNYKLMNDIDFKDSQVESIQKSVYFTGIFDGQGYTLKNFTLVKSTKDTSIDVSLFGSLDGKIINLNITGAKMPSVGGVIAGYVRNGSIENCLVEVTVASMTLKADGSQQGMQTNVNGGAFAYRLNAAAAKLVNCISVVTIAVTDEANVAILETWYGAFAGRNTGTIDNCQAIVLSGHTLKPSTSTSSNNAPNANCNIYSSISAFYDAVNETSYPGWVFDVSKVALPYVGQTK